jgi:hypothetical protein
LFDDNYYVIISRALIAPSGGNDMADHGPASIAPTPQLACRHPRNLHNQQFISNRNNVSFKIPANPVKLKPKPKSNRNKDTAPPHRESPFTDRHSRITNHFTNGASRAAVGFAERVILLDTNGRHERGCIFANSFKTNGRANFYSIQTDDFYSIQIDWQSRSRQPAWHTKCRPCTSWRDSLKMLGLR